MFFFKTGLQIANRFLKNKENNYSQPIVNLSVAGIALGLSIMIISLCVTGGYKKGIEQKVIGMGSHIRISNYDMNYSYEPVPFNRYQPFIQQLKQNPDIKNIQYFSTKVGIIKTDDQVEGIVLKGIDSTFLWDNFNQNIIKGKKINVTEPEQSQEILISSITAKKLKFSIGSKVRTYFIQDPPMQRSFIVAGIFETGLPEYDEKFAIVDLRQVQKLNNWGSDSIGGIEILIWDYNKIDNVGKFVDENIGYQLKAETIKQIYSQVFEWIALFDTNVLVLIIITIFVCIITMISTFLIIVLERTQTIGILKTLGMRNRRIISIFMLLASQIILKGIIIGNIIAFSICLIQKQFHLIKLDAATYYMSYIPINFNLWVILAVNIGVFVICLSVLTFPAYFVAKKISPISAIRFD